MKPILKVTLTEPIYDSLKDMIRSKELQPGEKIVQEKIAEMLGVSRTPLMKALQKLEHENFLISIPHKGMYVRKVSLSEMIDLYYCRESIECMATRLTTLHADSVITSYSIHYTKLYEGGAVENLYPKQIA